MVETAPKSLGSIYTPSDFAKLLTDWAVQEEHYQVLDVGVGEGVFTFAAHRRLMQLGASSSAAQKQVHGAEIDRPTFERFLRLSSEAKLSFPNVRSADYFKIDFPMVGAVIGNPPYVRRACIDDVEDIRQVIFQQIESPQLSSLSRLADLYVYFLLRAATQLKPGGRLAVITADSWLNARYGVVLKDYLKENFRIEYLMSFDRHIFDVEVKPVLLFATKKEALQPNSEPTRFIRVKNGLPASQVLRAVEQSQSSLSDVFVSPIKYSELKVKNPWGVYLKAPQLCDELAAHQLMSPLSKLGKTGIGIQTLAKEFFVLSPDRVQELGVEPEFLVSLAQSSRYHSTPCIEPDSSPLSYLFYCAKSKAKLAGTSALSYIKRGEKAVVLIRGKGKTVIGYHMKERIKRACRPRWYDLRSSLEQRERAEILIPRLINRKYQVVWNRARFVHGELFIGFTPHSEQGIAPEIYLAVLTSSLTEFLLRATAQLYGGGTYNVSPGKIGDLPVPDVTRFTQLQRETIKDAYLTYLSDKQHDRGPIDRTLFDILGFSPNTNQELRSALQDLIALGQSPKRLVKAES